MLRESSEGLFVSILSEIVMNLRNTKPDGLQFLMLH